MSSNLIKIIAAVFVVLAVFLAFVAYKMSHDAFDNANKTTQQALTQVPAAPQTQVVVATKPLLANEPIDRGSLKVVSMEIVPEKYYTSLDDVAGRIPPIDIDAGTPITPRLLGDDHQLAKLVPPGDKAVSLNLTDVIGVGGFVRPGDIVDVLVYLHNDEGNKVSIIQARILLKDALVLASDDHIVSPPPGAQPNQNNPQQQRHERTVVVAVPDEEVTRVMLGVSLGEVRLALHGQNHDQTQAASATPGGATSATPGAAAAAATTPGAAPAPTEVSGGSLPQNGKAAPAGPTPPAADQQLPDMPFTSAELAKLKPQHPASAKGTPQGIVIYRGSKSSTVYP